MMISTAIKGMGLPLQGEALGTYLLLSFIINDRYG
jgi:hypothetical protein